MGENPLPIRTKHRLNVVGRIEALVTGCAIANFKVHNITISTIDEMMRCT